MVPLQILKDIDIEQIIDINLRCQSEGFWIVYIYKALFHTPEPDFS